MTDKSSPLKLSVLIYLPRSTPGLAMVFDSVAEALSDKEPYEIILLDDGTGTGRELAGDDPGKGAPFRVVRFGRRFGESVAVDAGIRLARGDTILTLPAVRPPTADEVRRLCSLGGDTDLLIGYRTGHWSGRFDRLQMKVFYGLTRRATGTRFKDLSSGVRAFRREVAEEIALYGEMIRFLPILAVGRGYAVEEFPVSGAAPPGSGDEETARRESVLLAPGTYLNRLLDVLTLFFLLRFTRKPLRFFGAVGSTLLVPGLLLDVWLFLERIITGEPLAGRPILLLGILLTVLGVQTISIGLIGEMIIFTHSREIRDYSVREVLE